MDPNRIALIYIGDERSRAVCSLLLRHSGFRVYEVQAPERIIDSARDLTAELIVADLALNERDTLQQQLLDNLPNTRCLFIHERQTLAALEQTLRASVGAPADSSSQN